MSGDPTVDVHGEALDQTFLLMVESHVIAGARFAHDGTLLFAPCNANPGALELFEDDPLRVALALEWLREHRRLPRSGADTG